MLGRNNEGQPTKRTPPNLASCFRAVGFSPVLAGCVVAGVTWELSSLG